MSLRDLLGLYALVGLACAIAVFRRAPSRGAGALFSALMTVPLWPLWAPFALAPAREARARARPENEAIRARVDKALSDAVAAVADTPMSEVFTQRTATRIAAEVAHVSGRLADLERARGAKRLRSRRVGAPPRGARAGGRLRSCARDRAPPARQPRAARRAPRRRRPRARGARRFPRGAPHAARAGPLRRLAGRRSVRDRLGGLGPSRRPGGGARPRRVAGHTEPARMRRRRAPRAARAPRRVC